MSEYLAPITRANLSLIRSVSYSSLLLEALNPNLRAYSIFRHFGAGKLRTKHALQPLSLEDSFAQRVYIVKVYISHEGPLVPIVGP